MTHPVTQHSDSCCCSRCDQVEPDAGALHARLAELEHLLAAERIAGGAGRGAFEAAVRGQARAEERLAKIEAACEWLVAHQDERDRVRITKWFIERSILDRYDYRKTETEKHNGTGPSIINALIALHERAGT